MEKIINYEKDIEFNTRIGEISSISLEDFFDIDDGKLCGNFVLSGEYKTNELSVNKEQFDDNKLCVMIDYKLDYEVKPIIPSEEELNEDIELIEERKEIVEPEKVTETNEPKEEEETSIYHVHMFKEGETISSIAALYGSDESIIKEYNNTSSLNDKDKIIVPICDE